MSKQLDVCLHEEQHIDSHPFRVRHPAVLRQLYMQQLIIFVRDISAPPALVTPDRKDGAIVRLPHGGFSRLRAERGGTVCCSSTSTSAAITTSSASSDSS